MAAVVAATPERSRGAHDREQDDEDDPTIGIDHGGGAWEETSAHQRRGCVRRSKVEALDRIEAAEEKRRRRRERNLRNVARQGGCR